jgi:hypothetical protein
MNEGGLFKKEKKRKSARASAVPVREADFCDF